MSENKKVILVMGRPNTGKTASLRNLPQDKWALLNADLKEVPFKNKFAASVDITDPNHIFTYIEEIEKEPSIVGGVCDTITFLMSMYERMYVNPLAGTKKGQQAWGDYGNFYRDVIHAIKAGTKNYAILAHEDIQHNEQSMQMEAKVPIKGAVGRIGVEADFTVVLSAMQMPVAKLREHENDLLNITEEEEEDGVKYVFCTRVTKEFAGWQMRAPMGLWERKELFIDNDLNKVFNRLDEYYG